MGSIYLPYQKPPRWNISRAAVAYNCARMGLPMPDNRSLAMPFWEGAGNKVYNYSGNHHGTIEVDAPWEEGGINCNATGRRVTSTFVFGEKGTLVFIYKKAGTPHAYGRFLARTLGGATAFARDDADTKLNFKVFNTGAYTFTCPSVFDGYVHHIVLTYNTDTDVRSLYIDGIHAETYDATNISSDLESVIYSVGNKDDDASNYYIGGIISQFIKFPSDLIASQVQTLYNNPYGMVEPIRSPQWIVPLGATTVAPTTLAPTTIGPTTVPVATTPSPTTAAPTLAPTSLAPTTAAPADIRSAQVIAQVEWQGPSLIKSSQVLAQVEWVESIATTAAPTTAAPTTVTPTTAAPTTGAPTTPLPTTTAPTTLAPTTIAPTTLAPTTIVPTTVAPTTVGPTPAPTTVSPTTSAPTTAAPTPVPTTAAPTTAALSTVPPTTDIPETICIKNLRSVIIKEIRSDGYLC